MGNQQWTIQTNWQHKVHEKKNTICVGHHYTCIASILC